MSSRAGNEKQGGFLVYAFLPLLSIFALFLAGCMGITRTAVPGDLASEANIPGLPDVRAWGDEFSPAFQTDAVDSIRQTMSIDPKGVVASDGYINVLAVSGGGASGAYGAGLLCGWTEAGTRPKFRLVTGISTGAMTAPFAFLGPDYDDVIRKFYTSMTTRDIYTTRQPLWAFLKGMDAVGDTSPLERMIETVMDEKAFAAVAKAHREGRRLYIGTTNLDAQRLVIWNMGAIAANGKPGSLELFRKIMLASTAVPVMFPPVYIPVEARGKTYDEMHVDGGVSTQVFFYGFMLDLPAAVREAGVVADAPVRIYVIRNGQTGVPAFKSVNPRIVPIAMRSADSLFLSQSLGDLYRLYVIATRDGIDYRLANIPDDFKPQGKEAFDHFDMNRLFNLAYEQARKGYPWRSLPPGLTARPGLALPKAP